MTDTFCISPTLADAIGLPLQSRQVLSHLRKHGDITRLKADKVYGIVNLPDCILKLRNVGYDITTERPVDDAGVRYVRYVFHR